MTLSSSRELTPPQGEDGWLFWRDIHGTHYGARMDHPPELWTKRTGKGKCRWIVKTMAFEAVVTELVWRRLALEIDQIDGGEDE